MRCTPTSTTSGPGSVYLVCGFDPGCRGFVTADVLEKGLSRGAIATRKLKGVNRDKGHKRFYTSSAPYDEGKSLRLVVMELLGFR